MRGRPTGSRIPRCVLRVGLSKETRARCANRCALFLAIRQSLRRRDIHRLTPDDRRGSRRCALPGNRRADFTEACPRPRVEWLLACEPRSSFSLFGVYCVRPRSLIIAAPRLPRPPDRASGFCPNWVTIRLASVSVEALGRTFSWSCAAGGESFAPDPYETRQDRNAGSQDAHHKGGMREDASHHHLWNYW
jgi:hypothetical protein